MITFWVVLLVGTAVSAGVALVKRWSVRRAAPGLPVARVVPRDS